MIGRQIVPLNGLFLLFFFFCLAQVLLQVNSTDNDKAVLINGPTGVFLLFRPAVRQQQKIRDCQFGQQHVADVVTEHSPTCSLLRLLKQ